MHSSTHGLTERRACRLAKQPRGTQRYRAIRREDEDALTQAIVRACQPVRSLRISPDHGAAQASRMAGGQGSRGAYLASRRAERFRRSRSHEDDCGSTMARACGSGLQHRNHVWSYDFVSARTHDGRSVRLLNLIDEHTRESLLVRAERRWSSAKVISALADVMVMKGVYRNTFDQTMALSSWPKTYGNGWPRQEQRRCTSNPDLHGRTATARASTPSSGTSS